MLASSGVHEPHRSSWLSTQRIDAGRGSSYRSASRAARYTVLVAEPSATRPTLGKLLGRTELVDQAGDVVYSMDGWGLIGRRP